MVKTTNFISTKPNGGKSINRKGDGDGGIWTSDTVVTK